MAELLMSRKETSFIFPSFLILSPLWKILCHGICPFTKNWLVISYLLCLLGRNLMYFVLINPHQYHTINFLSWSKSHGGLEFLKKQLSVHTTVHHLYPHVIVFEADNHFPTFSPVRSLVVQECNGLVLRHRLQGSQDTLQPQDLVPGMNSEWEVLCFPFGRIFLYNEDKHSKSDEKYVPVLDWSHVKIFRLHVGFFVSLFFFNNSWSTSTFSGQSLYTKQFMFRFGIFLLGHVLHTTSHCHYVHHCHHHRHRHRHRHHHHHHHYHATTTRRCSRSCYRQEQEQRKSRQGHEEAGLWWLLYCLSKSK
eukprot:TRINITY_DN10228_c0_g1_i3.p2 TRINITY_DN10228_c0_g1~~TRINITY_DN10228_c0_g1_i3.p2  ORF type:complete len:306 (-),score=32.11 TRINITY_DN10228_c0_g1_i3:30-947(-)